MSALVRVEHCEDDVFEIAAGAHRLRVDQPIDVGGTDTAPTPTELFVAGLASCVAFYARRYLARHALSTKGLSVTAAFDMAERPTRVGEVRITLSVPEGVPEQRRAVLLAVASHCTVHNSLVQPPDVHIGLAG